MCWICNDWKKRSPKTFARYISASQGEGDPHTAHVIQYALAVANDIIAKAGIEQLGEALRDGAEIVWEGKGENLPNLTRADNKLVELVVQHELIAAEKVQ